MTSVLFYLLDVGHARVEGKYEIRLWGVDRKGRSILVCDRNFAPSFHLVLREASDADSVLNLIEASRTQFGKILSTTLVRRKFFGREVTALKITCQDQESLVAYAESLRKLSSVLDNVEDDIRPADQYLIEKGLAPCKWIGADVEKDKRAPELAEGSYLLSAPLKCSPEMERPSLKVMSFSTLSLKEKGSSKTDGDGSQIVISVRTSEGKSKHFEADKASTAIRDFVDFIREFDPDIIAGYQTNSVDWPLLIGKAKALGTKLSVDRIGREPHPSVHGHISVAGRANLDLFEILRDQPEPKVKTLQNVAEQFGIMKSPVRIEETEAVEYWKTPERRRKLRNYLAQNAELVLKLSDVFLDYATQLSSLTGLPLDHVASASMGFKVDSYLIREAHRLGELIPRRVDRPYFAYRGGLVLAPKPGLHENIAVLDFTSMYPNLMLLHNISPDTLVRNGGVDTEIFRVPELGYSFRRAPQGMYAVALASLLAERDKIRNQMSSVKSGSTEFRVLEAREKAVKTIANAMYGYAGWVGARSVSYTHLTLPTNREV